MDPETLIDVLKEHYCELQLVSTRMLDRLASAPDCTYRVTSAIYNVVRIISTRVLGEKETVIDCGSQRRVSSILHINSKSIQENG